MTADGDRKDGSGDHDRI